MDIHLHGIRDIMIISLGIIENYPVSENISGKIHKIGGILSVRDLVYDINYSLQVSLYQTRHRRLLQGSPATISRSHSAYRKHPDT